MNQIEDNLLAIWKCMFQERNKWKYVSDKQKEKWFFIINRNMAKKYPEKAQLLNLKSIDKATSMDLWFHFMKTQPYPTWFWSKSPKQEKGIPEKEYKQLLKHLLIKESDLDYLLDKYPDFIKEEQTYLKKLEKGN